jgi:hypothetical protein
MDSPNERKPAEQSQPAEAPVKKRRFQIVKLEDRIAPQKGGGTNKPHPCRSSSPTEINCGSFY